MISSPPKIGDKESKDWIREFLGYFEKVRFEFMRVEGIWFPALYNGLGTNVHGDHPGKLIIATESAFISVVVPRGTNEIKEAVIRLIPTTTGTIDWTANASYGGKNEDESAGTATKTADALSVTDDRVTEIDVTSLFDAVDADDQVGIEFVLDAVATTANVYVLGLYLKFR